MGKRTLTPEFREFLECLNRAGVFQNASGVDFSQAYPRRIESTLEGVPVRIISLADLRANKRASGRPKDLADLEQLPAA